MRIKKVFLKILIIFLIFPSGVFADKIYFSGLELNLLSNSDTFMTNNSANISNEYLEPRWNHEAINSENTYKLITEPKDIIIAVIDSGLYYSHPDLNPDNIYEGVNFLNEEGIPIKDTFDSMGHGTKSVGVIQRINPIAKILPIHVVGNNGKTSTSRTVAAINKIVEFNKNPLNKIKIKVINLSLGSLTYISVYEDAIQNAINNGIIVIAAVGNYAKDVQTKDIQRYPSAYKNVIGVGSVNENKQRSYFSQANSTVFVCAPGENIFTLNDPVNDKLIGELYDTNVSGTSMAVSHVVAMAGLAAAIDPYITQNSFKELLMKTSIDLGQPGVDSEYGYGLINVEGTVRYLLKEQETKEEVSLWELIKMICVFIWNFIKEVASSIAR